MFFEQLEQLVLDCVQGFGAGCSDVCAVTKDLLSKASSERLCKHLRTIHAVSLKELCTLSHSQVIYTLVFFVHAFQFWSRIGSVLVQFWPTFIEEA